MNIYFTSISTNVLEIENRAYKNFGNALEFIYNNLKELTCCEFFHRDYIQKYFTTEFFDKFAKVNCKSEYGEFVIEKVKDNRYQFVFIFYPSLLTEPIDFFIVCELEILELIE
jgi:hypothetical protein